MKILIFLLHFAFNAYASEYVLWYGSPAGNGMMEALVVGNGRIGGQVYGHPGKY